MREHKSGFVGVVGLPNVGKSTLTNRLLKEKVAITSRRPQTTRNRLLAILSEPEYQIIFIDTPGILKKVSTKLDSFMEEECQAAFSSEVDVLLLLMGADKPLEEQKIKEMLNRIGKNCQVFLVLNKVDLLSKDKVLALMDKYRSLEFVSEIFPISALHGHNVEDLLKRLVEVLPVGPVYYPEDIITTASERFVIQEIVREKLFRSLNEEVPYCVAVKTEEVKERNNGMFYISVTIYVEHDSQKAIIIGKQGTLLKKIGRLSRSDIETLMGAKVYLELWVKVEKNWRKNPRSLKKVGYSQKG